MLDWVHVAAVIAAFDCVGVVGLRAHGIVDDVRDRPRSRGRCRREVGLGADLGGRALCDGRGGVAASEDQG